MKLNNYFLIIKTEPQHPSLTSQFPLRERPGIEKTISPPEKVLYRKTDLQSQTVFTLDELCEPFSSDNRTKGYYYLVTGYFPPVKRLSSESP